jgi:predicted transcriptional regulator
MDNDLLEALVSSGLTNGEAKVYLALLSLGPSTTKPIVDTSGVSASKVYEILEKLLRKGLASVSIQDRVRVFSATDPERIMDYLNEEIGNLRKHLEKTRTVIPMLRAKKNSVGKAPPIEFTKGRKGFESLFNEAYGALKTGDSYFSLAGYRMSFKIQDYWHKQSKVFNKKNISQFLIYEQRVWYEKDPKVHKRSERKNYYPRLLGPEHYDLPNISAVGERSFISDVDDDGEIFCMFIRNKNLSNSIRKLVQTIYLSGSVPNGYPQAPIKK